MKKVSFKILIEKVNKILFSSNVFFTMEKVYLSCFKSKHVNNADESIILCFFIARPNWWTSGKHLLREWCPSWINCKNVGIYNLLPSVFFTILGFFFLLTKTYHDVNLIQCFLTVKSWYLAAVNCLLFSKWLQQFGCIRTWPRHSL